MFRTLSDNSLCCFFDSLAVVNYRRAAEFVVEYIDGSKGLRQPVVTSFDSHPDFSGELADCFLKDVGAVRVASGNELIYRCLKEQDLMSGDSHVLRPLLQAAAEIGTGSMRIFPASR